MISRKLTLLLAVGLVLFASCKKDRTCTCTTASGIEAKKQYTNITKKVAKADCESYSAYYASCKLD